MENMTLQHFIENCARENTRMNFVLPGAVISGEYENLTSLTFILTLKNCIIYTGKTSVSVNSINLSAEKDIIAWGIGNAEIK